MDITAPHFGFILAAYVISLGGIAALAGYVVLRDRRWRKHQDQNHDPDT